MPLVAECETSTPLELTTRFPPGNLEPIDSDRGSLRSRLTNLYGEEVHKMTREFSNLRSKISRLLCALTFLVRCRDNNKIPTCLTIKHHVESRSAAQIYKRAGLALVRERIRNTRRDLNTRSCQLYSLHLQLSRSLSQEDFDVLDRISAAQAERIQKLTTETHQRKFLKLNPPKPAVVRETQAKGQGQTVVNLSKHLLTPEEKSVLSKGFNYALTPRHIPVENIISSVEASIVKLPTEVAEPIRYETAKILRHAKPPTPNYSKSEFFAIKALKSNPDIVILKADKGNCSVVMDTLSYEEKMNLLLSDPSYRILERDPTSRITRSITDLIKNSPIPKEIQRSLIPRHSRSPRLYGLPKIHKPTIPLRPIVSSIDSPTYALSKFLANFLKQYTGNTDSFILNSQHFVQRIQDLVLDPGDLLVSFDVESLFTKVPILDTVNIVTDILTANNQPLSYADMVEKCLSSAYFQFRGKFYEQVSGAAMGSPLSPVVANIFMEAFEQQILESCSFKPKCWFRYVDDTFVIWPHGRKELDTFLQFLNTQHPDIRFTMEVEANDCLPFLDVLVTRNTNGTLDHSVYRKPTHTDRYLNGFSHHHPAQKQAVISTLVRRAVTITHPRHLHTELDHLTRVLSENNYPNHLVRKTIAKHLRPGGTGRIDMVDPPVSTAFLPYIQGTTDRIGRILGKYNIKSIFKPLTKVSDLLPSIKDKLPPLTAPGVYSIPCACGSAYIGETKRPISVRLSEHERCTRLRQITGSALAEHRQQTGHDILFDQTKILARESHYYPRKIREAIEILKHPANLNRDSGWQLHHTWKSLVVKKVSSTPTDTPADTAADRSTGD